MSNVLLDFDEDAAAAAPPAEVCAIDKLLGTLMINVVQLDPNVDTA